MALTYMPNANEVPKATAKSVLPAIVGLVVLLLVVGAGWFVLGGSHSSSSTSSTVVVVHHPARAATATGKPIEAVYGATGQRFKAAFASTPVAEADTGGIIVAFPSGSSVSGYVVTKNPQSFFQDDYAGVAPPQALNSNVISVPQYGVIASTLPRGKVWDASKLKTFTASLRFKTTPYRVAGYTGFTATGPMKQFLTKGEVVDNPDAQATVVFVVRGKSAFEVESAATTTAQAVAFAKSFRPVAG